MPRSSSRVANRRGTSPAARFAAFHVPKCSITVCGCTVRPGVGGELLHRRRPAEPLGAERELVEDLLVGIPASDPRLERRERLGSMSAIARYWRLRAIVNNGRATAERKIAKSPRAGRRRRGRYARPVRPPAPLGARDRGRARASGAVSRAPGAAAARRFPGSCSGRSTPTRSTASPPGSRDGIGARLRDERQDDDGGDGGRDPRARASGSPTTRRARTSSPASPPRCSRRATPSSGCSRWTRRRCRRSRGACGRARVCLGNLFRDQLDRYGELELVAERWRAAVAELAARDALVVERRRPAGRRARATDAAARRASASTTRAQARPALAARGRLEVLRPLRHAVRLRRRVRRPPRRLPLPARAATRGRRSTSPRARSSCDGLDGAAFDLVDARTGRAACSSRCPASTTSTTRSLRRRSRSRSASRSTRSSPGSSASRAAFGRFERIAIGDRRAPHAADQEPGGRERGHSDARRRRRARRRARRAQRRDRRRPRRLVDLGRRLRAARSPRLERLVATGDARRRARAALRATAASTRDRIEVDARRSSRRSTAGSS